MKNISIAFHASIHFLYTDEMITLNLNNPTNPTEFILETQKGYWIENYNYTFKPEGVSKVEATNPLVDTTVKWMLLLRYTIQ